MLRQGWVAGLVAGLSLALSIGCGTEESSTEPDDGTGTAGSTTMPTGTTAPMGEDTGPLDCVAGLEQCECLEGNCVGGLFCVDEVCLPGPEIDPPDSVRVVAGVRVALEVEVMGQTFAWRQVDGPTVDLGETVDALEVLVDVPPDAQPGDVITLEIEAELNTITETAQTTIEVMAAEIVGAFDDPDAEEPVVPPMLTEPTGLTFALNQMWVTELGGSIVRLTQGGEVDSRYDVGGTPLSAATGDIRQGEDDIEALLFGDGAAVRYLPLQAQEAATLTDALTEGGPLGAVEYAVARDNEDVVFSNGEGGQLFLYEADEGTTTVLLGDLGATVSAITFGPEEGVAYVATLGQIHRVPILPEDIAGEPSVYVDIGATDDITQRIEGMSFDQSGSLWVGVPGTSSLHLALYSGGGPTEIVRTFDGAGGELGEFVEPRFGGGDFDDESIYWVNPQSGLIGRLRVGLGN